MIISSLTLNKSVASLLEHRGDPRWTEMRSGPAHRSPHDIEQWIIEREVMSVPSVGHFRGLVCRSGDGSSLADDGPWRVCELLMLLRIAAISSGFGGRTGWSQIASCRRSRCR